MVSCVGPPCRHGACKMSTSSKDRVDTYGQTDGVDYVTFRPNPLGKYKV